MDHVNPRVMLEERRSVDLANKQSTSSYSLRIRMLVRSGKMECSVSEQRHVRF